MAGGMTDRNFTRVSIYSVVTDIQCNKFSLNSHTNKKQVKIDLLKIFVTELMNNKCERIYFVYKYLCYFSAE